MPSRRDAVLDGVLEATRLHETLETQQNLDLFGGRIDVFHSILTHGAELLFRKLEGLLGVYLPAPRPGILVTTERSLAIQRYTAAHELGHFAMGHRGSIDADEILNRSPFGSPQYDPTEIAADAFAAAFLIPDWLVEYHAAKQRWTVADLINPNTAYQLSLPLRTSYESTFPTLPAHQMITSTVFSALLAVPPHKNKQQIGSQDALPQC